MSIKIKAPTFPESVADGTIANWIKKEGDNVSQDDVIAEIETDKVVLEVIAQSDGMISKIIKDEGEIVQSAEVIGEFDESGESSKAKENSPTKSEDKPSPGDSLKYVMDLVKIITRSTQNVHSKSRQITIRIWSFSGNTYFPLNEDSNRFGMLKNPWFEWVCGEFLAEL